jgi:hypothetical protein
MRGRARTRARTTSDSNREHWAWPTTLKEAKPKAGSIAGIIRLPTTRTDHGSEAQKPDRHQAFRSSAPAIIDSKAADHPDENQSGRGRANGQQARGPGRTEMSAK